MAEIVPKEKAKREPHVQDLSELVNQTSRTLLDLDQRIQLMRNDLATMMHQANARVPTGAGAAWPQAQSGAGGQGGPFGEAFAGPAGASWGQPATGWPPQADPYRVGPSALMSPNLFGSDPAQGASYGASAYTQPSALHGAPLGVLAGPGAPQNPSGGGAYHGVPQQSNPYAMHAGQGQAFEAQQAHGGMGDVSPGAGQGTFAGAGGGRSAHELRQMAPTTREPASDIIDRGQEFHISLDLPGVKKEDLDIMVTDRSVIVTGQTQPDIGEGFVVVSERVPLQYRRTITLPNEIQTSECQAKLKDGVLSITVPKKVPTDGPRHINVAYA